MEKTIEQALIEVLRPESTMPPLDDLRRSEASVLWQINQPLHTRGRASLQRRLAKIRAQIDAQKPADVSDVERLQQHFNQGRTNEKK